MSGFRSLLEMSDKIAREELGDYYIMGASRMRNMLDCLESGAKQINELRAQCKAYRDVIVDLNDICERLPELNMSNFDIDKVAELNSGVIELTLLSRSALEDDGLSPCSPTP